MKATVVDKALCRDSGICIIKYDPSYIKHINNAYADLEIEVDRFEPSNRPIIEMNTTSVRSGDYLPVVRYENLYYEKSENQTYEGKFYYYEPDTAYHLHLGNYLIAANKYDAMRKLEFEIYGPDVFNFDSMLEGNVPHLPSIYFLARFADLTTKCITGGAFSIDRVLVSSGEPKNFFDDIPNKLLYNVTPFEKQLSAIFDISRLHRDRKDNQNENYLDYVHISRAVYAHKIMRNIASDMHNLAKTEQELNNMNTIICSNLNIPLSGESISVPIDESYNDIVFGKSDILDQPLVKYGRKCGYDTIILQREVGSYRVVTEVLDLRTRDTINVVYLGDEYINFSDTKKYPLIWTLEDGIVRVE
jgi:hypothetical protein